MLAILPTSLHRLMADFTGLNHLALRGCTKKLYNQLGGATLRQLRQDQLAEYLKAYPRREPESFGWACAKGFTLVARWLTERYSLTAASLRADNNWALRRASFNGHLETVEWLFRKFDITYADANTDKCWAFRWACANGHLKVAQLLVPVSLPTTAAMPAIGNAIYLASMCRRPAVVRWLFEYYATSIGMNTPGLHILQTSWEQDPASLAEMQRHWQRYEQI